VTRRRRRPRRKPPKTIIVSVVLAVLIAAILTATAVVVLTQKHPRPHAPVAEKPSVIPPPSSPSRPPAIVGEELLVKGCLYDLGIPRDKISIKGRTVHVQVVQVPPARRIRSAFSPLEGERGVSVRMEEPGRVTIVMNGATWDVIFERSPARTPVRARVAVIIDDMGQDMAAARRLASIDADLTFSVMPNVQYTTDVARYLHGKGREVLLHQPMEGSNGKNPGPGAIYNSTDPAEAADILRDSLAQVPYAVGVNNHMGSVVTRNRAIMDELFAVLKERDLFFLDSLTTSESVCLDAAAAADLRFAARDVFLDNVQDKSYISRQFDLLARHAVEHGYAVGICHPHPVTMEALEREIPRLIESGIEVVKVSQIVRRARD